MSEMASQKVHEDEPVVKNNFSAEPTAHNCMHLSADRNENVSEAVQKHVSRISCVVQ